MVGSADLAHLLRRTEFVARPQRMAELAEATLEEAVDDVLDLARNGSPQLPERFAVHDGTRGWEQYVDATGWWLDAMVTRPRPLQEKLALFWHGHFTSAWWDVGRADHMMRQNQLYRELGLGNLVTLTQRMALEPAMLIYLSNGENQKSAPNQNFARELMELFTLGVGNYTEADVEAAARAWTGHNYDHTNHVYVFRPTRHDTGTKTFFGTPRNWDGPEIIDEILLGSTRRTAARFVAGKLWDAFAHPGGPANVLDDLAEVLLANGMELRPLLRALLLRPEFYATTSRQGLVRSPVEWLVALSFHTGLTGADLGVSWQGERMGKSLFNPPNVSGWRPNAAWLGTSALDGRAGVARSVTWRLRDEARPYRFEDVHAMTVEAAVDHVAAYFGIHPLSSTTRGALVAAHRAERSSVGWASWWAPTNLLTMVMLAPELHMA